MPLWVTRATQRESVSPSQSPFLAQWVRVCGLMVACCLLLRASRLHLVCTSHSQKYYKDSRQFSLVEVNQAI